MISMSRTAGLILAAALAAAAPAALAQHPAPSGQTVVVLDHAKIMATIEALAPGTDPNVLQLQIRTLVAANAPAGANVDQLTDSVFNTFHAMIAQADTDPAARDHLKMMLAMFAAARTDPAVAAQLGQMLAMHAG